MSRPSYPSDISREVFNFISPILTSTRKRTKPIQVDIYDVFCAILYLLKTGCQWSMLPKDFPPKSTVHYHFKQWSFCDEDQPSKLDLALKKMRSIL